MLFNINVPSIFAPIDSVETSIRIESIWLHKHEWKHLKLEMLVVIIKTGKNAKLNIFRCSCLEKNEIYLNEYM
jgi:hypothetical protein